MSDNIAYFPRTNCMENLKGFGGLRGIRAPITSAMPQNTGSHISRPVKNPFHVPSGGKGVGAFERVRVEDDVRLLQVPWFETLPARPSCFRFCSPEWLRYCQRCATRSLVRGEAAGYVPLSSLSLPLCHRLR